MSTQAKLKYSLYSLLLALAISGVIIWLTGSNPFETYSAVIVGSFGNVANIMSVFAYTTPLILTGLGCCCLRFEVESLISGEKGN